MIDRQKLETLLAKRFPNSRIDQIAAAANAIMGLDDEWEEIGDAAGSPPLANAAAEFRVLRRRTCERQPPEIRHLGLDGHMSRRSRGGT